MLYCALVFLVIGLMAGALKLAGVSIVQISWVVFAIGTVLMAIHFVTGRAVPVK